MHEQTNTTLLPATPLIRLFKFKGQELPDLNFTPQQVAARYTHTYPALATATAWSPNSPRTSAPKAEHMPRAAAKKRRSTANFKAARSPARVLIVGLNRRPYVPDVTARARQHRAHAEVIAWLTQGLTQKIDP